MRGRSRLMRQVRHGVFLIDLLHKNGCLFSNLLGLGLRCPKSIQKITAVRTVLIFFLLSLITKHVFAEMGKDLVVV